MRFVVDECLPSRLARILADAGHDAAHVSDLGLLGAPDPDVMAAAVEGGRILISADTDFGELLARSGERKPSILLLRGSVRPADVRARLILDNLDNVTEDLETGAVVVLTDDRIRVRQLPIGLESRTR